jgi:hypothetical protein
MKLVDNWKQAHRWFSVHLIIVLAALPEVWTWLPMEWKQSLPPDTLKWVCGVVGILAVYARVVSQTKKVPLDDPKPDKEV